MNIPDGTLAEISQLATTLHRLMSEVEAEEEALERKKDSIKNLSETLIPEAMMAVGMTEFKLSDGTRVSVDKFYAGKIPEDKQDDAFRWLRSTGNDSIIKRELKCQFGKGENKIAEQIKAAILSAGGLPTDKQSVHPMTLKAFIRENMESGNRDFPAELFGAYVGNRTKIAPPKKG